MANIHYKKPFYRNLDFLFCLQFVDYSGEQDLPAGKMPFHDDSL